MAPSTTVELTVRDGVAWITLDGPERRNALDTVSAEALVDACDAIDADPSIGAAVISGAGRSFCSGADTGVLARTRQCLPDEAYELLDVLYAGFRRFANLGVPTVAAVDGAAVGAGLNLALAADVRIGTPDSVFLSGFAPLGITRAAVTSTSSTGWPEPRRRPTSPCSAVPSVVPTRSASG